MAGVACMSTRLRAKPFHMSDENTLSTSTSAPLGEISQEPPALEVFLDKHQMKLIILAGVLAVAAIAYVVVDGVKQGAEESAGAMLVQAEDASDLEKISAEHGGTAAAFSAKILLAEKQWEDGEQDEAIKTLRAFVDSSSDHPGRASAQSSLAAKLWGLGKTDEAAELFEEITEDDQARFLAPYAWISLGDIRMEKGDKAGAEKAYDAVGQEFSGTTFADQAARRKLILNAKAPVEVSAPISVPDVKFGEDAADDSGAAMNPETEDLQNLLNSASEAGSEQPEELEEESSETPPASE